MDNRIREALGAVRASEALKARTLARLEQEVRRRQRRPASAGLRLALCSLCCAVLLLGTGILGAWLQPVAYISIDINPSLELSVDRLNRVAVATPFNEEASRQLAELQLVGRSYESAVALLLEDGAASGYLAGDALVSFGVRAGSDRREQQLLDSLERQAASVVESAQLRGCTIDAAVWDQAHAHGMSAGKYQLILELMELDPTVTLEDCRHSSMSELVGRTESHHREGGGGRQGRHGGRHRSHASKNGFALWAKPFCFPIYSAAMAASRSARSAVRAWSDLTRT